MAAQLGATFWSSEEQVGHFTPRSKNNGRVQGRFPSNLGRKRGKTMEDGTGHMMPHVSRPKKLNLQGNNLEATTNPSKSKAPFS